MPGRGRPAQRPLVKGDVAPLKPGDPVIYVENPLLFGEMEVVTVRPKGMVQCIVDPDSLRPSFELFKLSEVAVPAPAPALAIR